MDDAMKNILFDCGFWKYKGRVRISI